MTKNRVITWLAVGLFLLVGPLAAFATDVVFVQGKRSHPVEQETVERLAEFYGLNFQALQLGPAAATSQLIARLKNANTVAVFLPEDALPLLNRDQVEASLQRPADAPVPILIFGITGDGDASQLNLWSQDHLNSCTSLPGFLPNKLKAGYAGSLTQVLSGAELPAVASPICRLNFQPGRGLEPVLTAQAPREDAAVLLHVQTKTSELFFAPQMKTFDRSRLGNSWDLSKDFSSIAPAVLFLSHAAGDYKWHTDGHYANLTIDDAWLHQPFGNLDYSALLAEMEKHDFHTTVAFIPWNFDRSDPGLVKLFREHPQRFSVCVHGNNHTHREFSDYSTNPLSKQIADIKQGIARMERFQSLTGIPYDRFMVFPQGVAPQQTFVELKRYGFLGTANYSNIPMDVKSFPADPTFLLRSYTANYGNFLSFFRLPVEADVTRLEIAIQAYMGTPMLFYGHEDLFYSGASAFNKQADFVNRIQPDTKWSSLGEIARHSQLIRRRQDGGSDVWMLSDEMELKNPAGKEMTFHIQAKEDPGIDPAMTMDGNPVVPERQGDLLLLQVAIPAGQTRKFRIAYANDLDLAHQDIRRTNSRAYALRKLSDLRDIYLSRFTLGHSITRFYYAHGWNHAEQRVERKWWVVLLLLVVGIAGVRYQRRRGRKRS
jgi:hypothetical protein